MARLCRFPQVASVTVIVGFAAGLLASQACASTAQLMDLVLPPECKYLPEGVPCLPGSAKALVYQAGGGEANVVTLAGGGPEVRISDRADVIQPGEGCSRLDRRSVTCLMPQNGLLGVFVATGGGTDTVRSELKPFEGGFHYEFIVDGGAGDDVLVGDSGDDKLFGGKGADLLRGRGGRDRLYDASPRQPLRSGVASPFGDAVVPLANPGRDRDSFHGGPGRGDAISYETRLASVRVDLSRTAATGGARGEHDSFMGIESVLGGAGDDLIAGDRHTNELDGAPGDDRIIGRPGGDFIEGGEGRNVIIGGPGNDQINGPYRPYDEGAERIFCGSGRDSVNWIFPSDFLNEDCEDLEFNFLREGGVFGGHVESLLPLRRGSAPTVLSAPEFWCYFGANPSGCQLSLEVRVLGPAARGGTAPSPGTLLGADAYSFSADERKSVSLSLTPDGVDALRRHKALRVMVSVTENAPHQPGGYQTVLRTP
jgi:hypothetical protein